MPATFEPMAMAVVEVALQMVWAGGRINNMRRRVYRNVISGRLAGASCVSGGNIVVGG